MGRSKRELLKKRLIKRLGQADDAGFLSLVWGVDALQSGRAKEAANIIAFRSEHAVTELWEKQFVHKWMLETLVNELLIYPKQQLREGRNIHLNVRHFDGIVDVYNTLHALEEAEYTGTADNVLDEVTRLGLRQFEWQRGWVNIVDLYRSAYLFGGEHSLSYFEAKSNISLAAFMLAAFASFVRFQTVPALSPDYDLSDVGISKQQFASALNLISTPIEKAQDEAKKLRAASTASVAYRPSLLRRSPCISFGDGKQVFAPLPVLVMARATMGVYYDLVGARGDVAREIGDRFESYCFEYLQKTLGSFEWRRAERYYHKGPKETPDILATTKSETGLVVECKSKRMTIAARYGEAPLSDAREGFDEIAKGVCQIWRYFSHVRKGAIQGHRAAADAIGLVLTLDPWLQSSRSRYPAVISLAVEQAAKDPDIEEIDKRPIAFCSVEDLEALLVKATPESFLSTVRAASSADRSGWHLSILHDDIAPGVNAGRKYPFRDRLNEVLPWWAELDARKKATGV